MCKGFLKYKFPNYDYEENRANNSDLGLVKDFAWLQKPGDKKKRKKEKKLTSRASN